MRKKTAPHKLGRYKLSPFLVLKRSVLDKSVLLILDQKKADFYELDGIFAQVLPNINARKDLSLFFEKFFDYQALNADQRNELKTAIRDLCRRRILVKA